MKVTKRDKWDRFWSVIDDDGTLVCRCLYKCGAQEVVRRLEKVPVLVTTSGTHQTLFPAGTHQTSIPLGEVMVEMVPPALAAEVQASGSVEYSDAHAFLGKVQAWLSP